MKSKSDLSELVEHINSRFDYLEKMVTLSLISDILPGYVSELHADLTDDVNHVFEEKGFVITKSEIFSNKVAIYIKPDKKVGIKDLREMVNLLSSYSQNLILVFELEKVTITQKRKFFEEKISYFIDGKELYIADN